MIYLIILVLLIDELVTTTPVVFKQSKIDKLNN